MSYQSHLESLLRHWCLNFGGSIAHPFASVVPTATAVQSAKFPWRGTYEWPLPHTLAQVIERHPDTEEKALAFRLGWEAIRDEVPVPLGGRFPEPIIAHRAVIEWDDSIASLRGAQLAQVTHVVVIDRERALAASIKRQRSRELSVHRFGTPVQ